MDKIRNFWETLTIKNKIAVFTISVFVALSLSVLFDAWVVKLFTKDFNDIMEDNSRGGEIVNAIKRETDAFDEYIRGTGSTDQEAWEKSVEATREAIYAVPLDYTHLGDSRFAVLQSLQSAYEVYCSKRNQVITDYMSENIYVDKLYDVYNMQNYLSVYAQRFVDVTMQEGNESYRTMLPVVARVPFITAALSIALFFVIFQISQMLNSSVTKPVLKLANASRRIANNDFFIDDVVVDNKDELGQMVSAFNKMKFATGEYIKAMEEKREALDQLHVQELENLEIEKQMETMNLELLKSQINPHFLFNTLNVIAGTANLEGAQTTEQMIEALSSLFRYNLKTQAKESLLAQELKISRDYMYLQKMRFGDRVQFDIECDVDENKVIVPTFTFQPLLENAIIHGISPRVEGGKVQIKVKQQEDKLLIEVSDTGAGMDEETLLRIRAGLEGGEDTPLDEDIVGIGLGNINRRIKGMYEGGSLSINSTLGEGTTILMTLPLHRVDD
ncbi:MULTISPECIES: sensor histidine kinase [unclassified Butyrivibrio]|uniref:sensor histidine kinase n=1 Tax=unclassified Butyrivibrio TaxID=2639466 RepID=UPI0003B46A9A|nr:MULTISPECIES: sensor histidine kinase [unclassified Butyrivibrio]